MSYQFEEQFCAIGPHQFMLIAADFKVLQHLDRLCFPKFTRMHYAKTYIMNILDEITCCSACQMSECVSLAQLCENCVQLSLEVGKLPPPGGEQGKLNCQFHDQHFAVTRPQLIKFEYFGSLSLGVTNAIFCVVISTVQFCYMYVENDNKISPLYTHL